MPDPSLWFGQLSSLPGAMPKTKLISLAWSLPIFSSFFECSPTISIPACPVTKAAQIIASSFPQLLEGSCLNHCALFLSQDSLSPGLEAAWVARSQGLALPHHAVPMLLVYPHMDLADTNCPPGSLPLLHSVENCQQLDIKPGPYSASTTLTPCNPCCSNHMSHVVVCPVSGPGFFSSGLCPWLLCSETNVL